MGGLFGSTEIVNREDRIASMRVQSSAYGMVVPWVRGKTRITGNLMSYGDFQAIEHRKSQSSGKGGGVESTSITYTYRAAVMIGLCSGVITEVRTTWRDKNKYASPGVLGFVTFTGAAGQAPWAYMSSKHPSQALGYSQHAYVAAGPLDLGRSASLGNFSFEVVAARSDASMDGDANPALILEDFLAGDDGAGMPPALLGDWTQYSTWCQAAGLFMSPALVEQAEARELMEAMTEATHVDWLWSEGVLKILPRGDQAITANGASYTPNMPVVYDLTDDDFIAEPGEPPVKLTRRTPADAYNQVEVQFVDRAKDYNTNSVTAKDLNAIITYGLRPAPVFKTHAQRAEVAQVIADLRPRRLLNIRNLYRFTLMANKIGLEPGDIVTLTDDWLGLDKTPVRILDMDESEDGDLDFKAEEWPFEVSSHVVYPTDPNSGYSPNYNASAPDVNSPVVFEPPTALSGAPQVWLATSGSAPGWGGADVFVSLDGLNYERAGQITQKAIHGTLSATLATSAVSPDTVNTASVNLTVSAGTLNGGSTIDADALVTLCWVGGELLAYRDATLTAANQYDLDYLVRGAYGSAIGAHAAGSAFVRLDDAVLKLDYPAEWVGQTIYIKMLSWNEFGGGKQTLADVTATTYTIQGEALPAISNLVADGAWTGPDVSTRWDAAPSARAYVVEVYAGTTLRRTVGNITDPRYTYSFAANKDDGLARALIFKVYAESATGALSQPTQITLSNPQIGAPTGLVLVAGMGSITVGTTRPSDADYAGTMIWVSTTAGFTPTPSDLAYDGPDSGAPVLDLQGGLPVYVRVAHYDRFGQDGVVMSSEVSTTPYAPGGGIEVVGALPTDALVQGRTVYLTTDDKLYRYDGSAWVTWVDGSDILAASITAGKLSVANLSAISASLGSVTSGNMTIDATGFIRGGATGYLSGVGWWQGDSGGAYKAYIGSPTTYMAWDGVGLSIQTPFLQINPDGSAYYSGPLNGATGTFNGSLAAGVIDFSAFAGESTTYGVGVHNITVPNNAEWNSVSMRVTLQAGGGGGGGANTWSGGILHLSGGGGEAG